MDQKRKKRYQSNNLDEFDLTEIKSERLRGLSNEGSSSAGLNQNYFNNNNGTTQSGVEDDT